MIDVLKLIPAVVVAAVICKLIQVLAEAIPVGFAMVVVIIIAALFGLWAIDERNGL